MINRRTLLVMVVILLSVFIGGCDNNSPSAPVVPDGTIQSGEQQVVEPGSQTNSPSTIGQETMTVTVYNATKDAMHVVAEHLVVPKNDHPRQTAIELLAAGTKNAELVSVMPTGTKLRSISVKNKIAYVDFNNSLVKNSNGGSASEMLLVAAIVNTLTEFHDIQKVQIMVDGKKIDTISGHTDIGEPLSRSEKIIKK